MHLSFVEKHSETRVRLLFRIKLAESPGCHPCPIKIVMSFGFVVLIQLPTQRAAEKNSYCSNNALNTWKCAFGGSSYPGTYNLWAIGTTYFLANNWKAWRNNFKLKHRVQSCNCALLSWLQFSAIGVFVFGPEDESFSQRSVIIPWSGSI